MIWPIITLVVVIVVAVAAWQWRRLALARRASKQRPVLPPWRMGARPDDDRPPVCFHGYMLDAIFVDDRPWLYELSMLTDTREEFFDGLTEALWVYEGAVTVPVEDHPDQVAVVRRSEWSDLDQGDREEMYTPTLIDELRGNKDIVLGV